MDKIVGDFAGGDLGALCPSEVLPFNSGRWPRSKDTGSSYDDFRGPRKLVFEMGQGGAVDIVQLAGQLGSLIGLVI